MAPQLPHDAHTLGRYILDLGYHPVAIESFPNGARGVLVGDRPCCLRFLFDGEFWNFEPTETGHGGVCEDEIELYQVLLDWAAGGTTN